MPGSWAESGTNADHRGGVRLRRVCRGNEWQFRASQPHTNPTQGRETAGNAEN